jgi:hypothetical protein
MEKATELWREALEIDPGHPDAERCLKDSGISLPQGKK